MASKASLFVWIIVALCIATVPALAQSPIANGSFEQGLASWTAYTYQPLPEASPVSPSVGCIGLSPCVFTLLHPPTAPDGKSVCGVQSYETTGNGGVCQSFAWSDGPAAITVSARAYSEKYDGTPRDNGCRVRIGLVAGDTQDRALATWTTFPWSDAWHKRSLRVPGSGTYTLFIEAYQPDSTSVMSTLWDHVEFSAQPPVLATSGPTVTAGDPAHPDTTATVTWTTDTPSTSTVEYGATPALGQTVTDSALVTNHSVLISGLTHSGLYYFRARSTATGCVDWVSDDLSFHTPIWISGISTRLSPDGSGAIVDWTTDAPATSQVEYWSSVDPHAFTAEVTTLSTTHSVPIPGLVEGRQYSYRVISRNQPDYSDALSAVGTFWTLPPVSPVLANGDFEDVRDGDGHSIYPWVQYTVQEGATGFYPIDGLVGPYPTGGPSQWYAGVRAYDGSYFVGAAANQGYKNGGIFQRVTVRPGDLYAFTVRYMTYQANGNANYTKVSVGVDPNGGVDPRGSGVQWWSGHSDLGDSQWHSAAVAISAGESGVATVFLEFQQLFALAWHVSAVDDATFSTPLPISIGGLKASKGSLGGVLENKIVTYAYGAPLWVGENLYHKAYVQEDNRTAGLAVLFPSGSYDYPVLGNRITITGALGVYSGEAAILATSWTIDHDIHPLPAPVAMPQRSVGKSGPNQPGIMPNAAGLCNTGLRVRVFGRVTSTSNSEPGDAVAYVDDGSKFQDASAHTGLRVQLMGKESEGAKVGDYIAVTGVLAVLWVDPNRFPGDGDEYYTYAVLTGSSDDWNVLF